MLCVCVYVCWLLHSLEKNIMLSVWVTATYMGPFIWYGRYASWRIQLIGEAETSWPHIHASLICSFPVSTSSKTIQPCRSFENMLCIGFGFFMWNEEAKSRSRACVTKKKDERHNMPLGDHCHENHVPASKNQGGKSCMPGNFPSWSQSIRWKIK